MYGIYTNTSDKAKNGKVYALGRDTSLHGKPTELGGYGVAVLCENYDGKVYGGISKSWRWVETKMSHADAISLMNKRLGRKEFVA